MRLIGVDQDSITRVLDIKIIIIRQAHDKFYTPEFFGCSQYYYRDQFRIIKVMLLKLYLQKENILQ
jgi:hypothetical protein